MKRSARLEIDCQECEARSGSAFAGLCAHNITNISSNKTCTVYKKGQMLFHEGTRPMGVYCINSGNVKVYKTGIDGKEQIIQICKSGDLLGYRAMLGEELFPVSAETLNETNICFIPRTDFLTSLQDEPQLHVKLMQQVCKELGVMTESLTNLSQKTVRERLAAALLMLRDTYGMDGADNGAVEINLTREDLANFVGTATETLIRLLHDFKEESLVETAGRTIRVTNPKGLVKVANLY